MLLAIITALGVGGATILGAIIGFGFKKISQKFADVVLAFASGVMLASAILGLILPSIEYGGEFGIIYTVLGIFAGALCLNLLNKTVSHLNTIIGFDKNAKKDSRLNKVLLFVLAIALHNLPEGIAAGVGFGTQDLSQALMIAGGIALQNLPEGMVIISPMLAVGISKRKTFFCAMLTGIIEIIGTLIGYFAVSLSTFILPFALSFAGGTMIYIIVNEIIPETHSHNFKKSSTYALLFGFCIMLVTYTLL